MGWLGLKTIVSARSVATTGNSNGPAHVMIHAQTAVALT